MIKEVSTDVFVSFVHGYEDLENPLGNEERPAIWTIRGELESVHRFPFPRTPSDFRHLEHLIVGEMPKESAPEFQRLPRFGFMGLWEFGGDLYAMAWNGVYRIDRTTMEVIAILSHSLMCDGHGVYVDDEKVVSVLTGKDTVVLTGHDGEILDHFSIGRDLEVRTHDKLLDYDWRFIGKQFRGSSGYWHFNYVQVHGQKVWLTSRNASSFVVVDLNTKKAHLRLLNFSTPHLLHDGDLFQGRFYFTSIDGKIFIVEDGEETSRVVRLDEREIPDVVPLFNRDLVTKLIRLEETEFGREPNWCRGIAPLEDRMFVTVDGRYGTDLSFGLIEITEGGSLISERRLQWSDVGEADALRYVAGFDICVVPASSS